MAAALPPPGVRQLNVLGEFKPFGLIADAVDGGTKISEDKYDYFLFDPSVAREQLPPDPTVASTSTSTSCDGGDHEIFIRGNRVIWTAGSRVYKRFTSSSPVIMACWCHMDGASEALLCVLQSDSLTTYNASGEVAEIPLPCTIASIWPLPFGLLLQQGAEGEFSANFYSKSSNLLFGASPIASPRREFGQSPRSNSSFLSPSATSMKWLRACSSHMILRDVIGEPELVYVEERGKLNVMADYDERTIWTSDKVPLMASYNKGKMQHSLWVVEVNNSSLVEAPSNIPDLSSSRLPPKKFSFHRIWHLKGAHSAASKVFLATDDDQALVVCFLLHGQKKLLSVRLQSLEISSEILFDIKPELSWSMPAVSAAPLMITRPRAKVGYLPRTNIVVLAPENTIFLYAGKQCLCRFLLPCNLVRCQNVPDAEFTGSASYDAKVIGVADAVDDRFNVIMNNGQMFRCAIRQGPPSSLLDDCVSAMAEGMRPSYYNYFLALLWGTGDPVHPSRAGSLEWNCFSSILLKICHRGGAAVGESETLYHTSWDFLVNSQFHQNYHMPISLNVISPSGSQNGLGCSMLNLEAEPATDIAFHRELMMDSMDSLHAVYESLKLDNLRKQDLELLAVPLCTMAKFLGEEGYVDHYMRDFPSLLKDVVLHESRSTKSPPSLFRWLAACLQQGCGSADINELPLLVRTGGSSIVSYARKIVSFFYLLCGGQQDEKDTSSGVFCNVAVGSYSTNEEHTVLAMVGERFGLRQLDCLPPGVSLPLRHALAECREFPPSDWPVAAYILLGREDLAMMSAKVGKPNELDPKSQEADNLFTTSSPYMLHLHPVTVPSNASDIFSSESNKFEDTDSVDGSKRDGMEHIFTSSRQLRYGKDLRLNEVRRLLCSAQPVAIHTPVNPSASDQELQQAQLWQMAQRTTSLPIGRGAFTLGTIYTLLTEGFTVPKLVLSGRLPSQQNATVNLDPNMRNVQELKSWPEFHNAVAAGLRLAPFQGKMSRTWIVYNKPGEPNSVHAGLLLALGLHGFLRVLRITDIYQYLSEDHESSSVGLLLGLAASYRGTMDPSISKVIFVHIPAQHPTTFPEVELPTLVQSAALMSVGLLYEGSAHLETMQTLLIEIGRRSGGDNVLEREGYAVSAGFSLGLIALGRGRDALGLLDPLLERLFQYAGGSELHNDRFCSSRVSNEDHIQGNGQMMDGATFNIDVTAPGAIIALALMFLKTESEIILSRIPIPCTLFELQYVRPDFIMLRVIARNMIMWSRVIPSKEWMLSQVPEIVQNGVSGLKDDIQDFDEPDVESFIQAYVNIVTGACISVGLRFAGTMDGNAKDLLYEFAVDLLNEIKPVSSTSGNNFPKGLSRYIDRGTLEISLHLIILSLCAVMSGSGDLKILRLLKFLRNRSTFDGHSSYGIQMSISLAIGFLFLGGGMRTFSTHDSSIAALMITMYPRLPTGPHDNRCHLQAFRHFFVLAAEARWIQTVDVDTGLPVYAPLEVSVKESELYSETSFCEISPCILPERSVLKSLCVCGPRYWPHVINLAPEEKPWWTPGANDDPLTSGTIYIKRKVGACSYVDDPIGCQSLLSRAMHKVFSLTHVRAHIADNDLSVDQIVSTFSSDPSLIAFAQLCCDPSWNLRSEVDFQNFCKQVLFDCVSKDRPALLQVYLSLYTSMESLANLILSDGLDLSDSLAISNLKLVLAYSQAVLSRRLTSAHGGMIQSTFIGSLKKQLDDLLDCCHYLKYDLSIYMKLGRWPFHEPDGEKRSVILSWYLQWFGVPSHAALKKVTEKLSTRFRASPPEPLLQLFLPHTRVEGIKEIRNLLYAT